MSHEASLRTLLIAGYLHRVQSFEKPLFGLNDGLHQIQVSLIDISDFVNIIIGYCDEHNIRAIYSKEEFISQSKSVRIQSAFLGYPSNSEYYQIFGNKNNINIDFNFNLFNSKLKPNKVIAEVWELDNDEIDSVEVLTSELNLLTMLNHSNILFLDDYWLSLNSKSNHLMLLYNFDENLLKNQCYCLHDIVSNDKIDSLNEKQASCIVYQIIAAIEHICNTIGNYGNIGIHTKEYAFYNEIRCRYIFVYSNGVCKLNLPYFNIRRLCGFSNLSTGQWNTPTYVPRCALWLSPNAISASHKDSNKGDIDVDVKKENIPFGLCEKCQIWSLGATVFEMLFDGLPPRWDMPPLRAMFDIVRAESDTAMIELINKRLIKNNNEIEAKNKKHNTTNSNDVIMSSSDHDVRKNRYLSNECKNWIQKCCMYQEKNRFDCQEAANDEWITKNVDTNRIKNMFYGYHNEIKQLLQNIQSKELILPLFRHVEFESDENNHASDEENQDDECESTGTMIRSDTDDDHEQDES